MKTFLILFLLVTYAGYSQIIDSNATLIDFTGSPNYLTGFAMDDHNNAYFGTNGGGSIELPDTTIQQTGLTKMFKVGPNGEFKWSLVLGGGVTAPGIDAYVSGFNDHIYISGYSNNYSYFPAYADPQNIYSSTYYISKVDSSGIIQYITRFPGHTYFDEKEDGNIAFVTQLHYDNGYIGNQLITDDMQIVYGEMESTGSILWFEQISVNTFNFGSHVQGCNVKNNRLLFYGTYNGSADFANTTINLSVFWSSSNARNTYLAAVDMASHDVTHVTKTTALNILDVEINEADSSIYLLNTMGPYSSNHPDGVLQNLTLPFIPSSNYIIKLANDLSYDTVFNNLYGNGTMNNRLQMKDIELQNNELYMSGYVDSVYNNGTGFVHNGLVLRLDENLQVINDYKYPVFSGIISNGFFSSLTSNSERLALYSRGNCPAIAASIPNFNHEAFVSRFKINSNEIKGRAFKDFNQNGIYDLGDVPIQGSVISVTPSANMAVTFPDGTYTILVDSGQYTLELESVPSYYTKAPASVTLTFNGNNLVDSTDLTLIPVPGQHDIKVDLIEEAPVVVNSIVKHKIIVTNEGTFTEDGTVKLFPLSYSLPIQNLVTTPSMSQQPTNLEYGFTGLLPGQQFEIIVEYTIGPGFLSIIGENSNTTAEVSINNTDVNLLNNSATLTRPILASYDPNIKLVNKPDSLFLHTLSTFDYLTYTIHFQNEGNYHATHVRIEDKISDMFDILTLQVIDASHQLYTEINQDKAIFNFDSIMLPHAAADNMASRGYVTFKLKKPQNLAVSDEILNRAFIYFDQNPPIITGYAKNLIVESLASISNDDLAIKTRVVPNPFTNFLQVNFTENMSGEIEIYNLKGQIIKKQSFINAFEIQLDTEDIQSGIYFMSIIIDKKLSNYKLVK